MGESKGGQDMVPRHAFDEVRDVLDLLLVLFGEGIVCGGGWCLEANIKF